jgi:hypothetical protein
VNAVSGHGNDRVMKYRTQYILLDYRWMGGARPKGQFIDWIFRIRSHALLTSIARTALPFDA